MTVETPPAQTGTPSLTPTPTQGTPVAEDWRSILPEDVRGEKSLDVFATAKTKDEALANIAKSYVHAQKSLGNKISLPDEKDTKGWDALYNKLGRPESADKYQVERPKFDEGSGVKYDEAMEKKFLSVAHGLGLNNKQAQKLIEWQVQEIKGQAEGFAQARNEAIETLKKEWGNNYDNKLSVAHRFIKDYAPDSVIKALDATGLGNDPAFVKFMYEMGVNVVEETPPAGKGQVSGDANTVEAAMKKRDSLMIDPEFSKRYFNQRAAGHADAVEEIHKLNKVIVGAA